MTLVRNEKSMLAITNVDVKAKCYCAYCDNLGSLASRSSVVL